MSLATWALVVSGAILHALWNLAAKKAAGGAVFVWLFGLVSLGLALPVALCLTLWQPPAWQVSWIGAVLATGVLHVVYSLVLQRGYQAGDFSLVYPVARGTGPVLAVAGAVGWMGEWPSAQGWAGVGLVLGGMGLSTGLLQGWRSGDPRCWRGLGWGALTGLCIAAYTLVDGWAVKRLGCPPVLYYALGLVCRAAFLFPMAWRERHRWRAQWQLNQKAIWTVGVLSPLAYVLILVAMQSAPLSYVAPLREVSMVIGVWLGAWVLGESQWRWRLVGTLVMASGVAVLAWA